MQVCQTQRLFFIYYVGILDHIGISQKIRDVSIPFAITALEHPLRLEVNLTFSGSQPLCVTIQPAFAVILVTKFNHGKMLCNVM